MHVTFHLYQPDQQSNSMKTTCAIALLAALSYTQAFVNMIPVSKVVARANTARAAERINDKVDLDSKKVIYSQSVDSNKPVQCSESHHCCNRLYVLRKPNDNLTTHWCKSQFCRSDSSSLEILESSSSNLMTRAVCSNFSGA